MDVQLHHFVLKKIARGLIEQILILIKDFDFFNDFDKFDASQTKQIFHRHLMIFC